MKERNNKLMKKLDLFIGCPLLFILGIFRKKKELPNLSDKDKNYHFVVIKTAAIGDTILTSAIIHELRGNFTNCKITYICSKNNAAMAKLLNGIDEVRIFNMSNPVASLMDLRSLSHADIIFDFAPWTRINGVITYMIKASYKIGFRCKGMGRHYIYDCAVTHQDDIHEIDNYRNLLVAANIPIHQYNPVLTIQKNDNILSCFSLEPKKYVIFHLYAGGSKKYLKEWPIEKWVMLADKVYHEMGYVIVLTGGKEDVLTTKQVCVEMKKKSISAITVAGKLNLEDTASLIKESSGLISIDTGIIHLGATTGINVIGLYGPTSFNRWGAKGENVIAVESDETCRPCISLGFDSKCTTPLCMQHISVDNVYNAVQASIKEY